MPAVGPSIDVAAMHDVAVRAALAGGEVVAEARGAGTVQAKGRPGDWVTEVDLASELAIGDLLEAATPSIPMRGEETGGGSGGRGGGGPDRGPRWIVDPLDGTTNFIHGFPAVGVSVALVDGEAVVAGAIHAPFLGTTWHGAQGMGATARRADGSEEPLSISARGVGRAVVGTGFPFRRKEILREYLGVFEAAFERFEDLRRPGAASLDLAWVAEGVFEGFFELGLSSWDVAAGGLLIREAGGVVSDWGGGDGWLGGDIVAGSPEVWKVLVSLTTEAGRA